MSMSKRWLVAFACSCVAMSGCGGDDDSPAASAGGENSAAVAAPKSSAGYATGKVTMEDGSPPRGNIKSIDLSIGGVSEAAEKVWYSPVVKPDGTYKQKLAGGQYRFDPGKIVVEAEGVEYRLPLEPVGPNWSKNQDSSEPIEQDFVWKLTGVTPYGKSNGSDPSNHTHWYGMTIGMRPDGYRNDISATVVPLPKDTKLNFKLVPKTKGIDGSTLETIKLERTYDPNSYKDPDLNDVPFATYELTGTATLPDGTTKPLLLRGNEGYPNYFPSVTIVPQRDEIIGNVSAPNCVFVVD